MFKKLYGKLTKSYNEVPLFYVTFNLNKYYRKGEKGSCDIRLHPDINDEHVKIELGKLIDYIRANYDMEKLSK